MALLELLVTVDTETSQVQVKGPLHAKMPLVYALEEAKRLVQNFDPSRHKPALEIPNGPVRLPDGHR